MKLNLTLFLFTFALSAEEFLEYKVIKGDTLSKVCKTYLSDPKKWRDLLQYNSIASPNLISPGSVLRIPDSLRKKVATTAIVPIAKLQNKTGNIRLKKPDFEEWYDGDLNRELFRDDLLRTGEESSAEILFKEEPQAIVFLEEKSIMKIRKDEIKSIELKLGTLLFKSTNAQNNKTILNVKTNSADSNIQGQEAEINSDEKKASFAAYKGKLDVSAQNQTVIVPEGFGTYVLKGSAPMKPYKLPEKVKVKPTVNK